MHRGPVPVPAVPTPADASGSVPVPAVPTPADASGSVPVPAVPTPANASGSVPVPAVLVPAVASGSIPVPAVPASANASGPIPVPAVPAVASSSVAVSAVSASANAPSPVPVPASAQVVTTQNGKIALAIHSAIREIMYLNREHKTRKNQNIPLDGYPSRMAMVPLDKGQMSSTFRIAAWIAFFLSSFMAVTLFSIVIPMEHHTIHEVFAILMAIVLSLTTVFLFIAIVKSMNLGKKYKIGVLASTISVFVLTALILYIWFISGHTSAPSSVPPLRNERYRVCFTNIASNQISVLDSETNQTLADIPVRARPNSIAIAPDQSKSYASNQWNASVSVFNTTTYQTIANITVRGGPRNATFTPDGKEVWVSNEYNNTVSVIDVETDQVIATIPVGVAPGKIVFATTSHGEDRAYVLNYGSATITVINRNTYKVKDNVTVGLFPVDIVAATSAWLYVVCEGDVDIYVIDIDNDENPIFNKISVAKGLRRAVVDNKKGLAYAVQSGTNDEIGTVFVINIANDKIVASITVEEQPLPLLLSLDGSRLYVANTWSSAISVIDTATRQVIDTINLVNEFMNGILWTMEMTPDGSQIFVTYNTIRFISIINTATPYKVRHVQVKGQFHEVAFVEY
jgi:YVTN family beta-propeller protein